MTFLYVIFGILGVAVALAARVFFWNSGRTKEQLKAEKQESEALREEIRKIEQRPVLDSDYLKLFERARAKAKARENPKR